MNSRNLRSRLARAQRILRIEHTEEQTLLSRIEHLQQLAQSATQDPGLVAQIRMRLEEMRRTLV